MTESTITCPNCTTAIPLAESLAATGKQFVVVAMTDSRPCE